MGGGHCQENWEIFGGGGVVVDRKTGEIEVRGIKTPRPPALRGLRE